MTFNKLAILLLIAVAIIFYQYPSIPKYLFFDEVEFAKLALTLNNQPYTPYSELATGHTTLYFYIILSFFKLFGISTAVLRLPSALFGIAGIFVFYKIMELIFERKTLIVFLTTFIFLSLRWYFNFARYSFEVTFLLFLELTSLYFFLSFYKTRSWKYLFISAVFAGLSFHSYHPGRIFFILPLIFLILFQLKRHVATYIGIVLVISIPLLMYFNQHPDLRFEDKFFLKDEKYTFLRKVDFVKQNLVKTILMFHVEGDMNGRHNYTGKPALNPLLGLLFIAGLFIAIKNFRNTYHQVFLFYFILSLIPSLLTPPSENPNMLRTFTVIPS
ncbi:glycosyltransferase family 39 protein, partial [Candidatus Roizmanbacteria bacterium]|nr:glycosyltransferase family 39 protein [Candidatus Roizmanbacteria bacterium]